MFIFFAALLLFVVTHMIPSFPGVRRSLIARLGRGPYIAVYSVMSIALLAFLIHATLALDHVVLWDSAPWQAWVTLALAPMGLFLILAGLLAPNELSITARRRALEPGAIVAVTRHPVLWGFMLWSAGHLVPNGELRAVLLFGLLFLFALLGVFLSERRAKRHLGERWAAVAAGTSIVPFVAIAAGRARFRIDTDMIVAFLVAIILVAWLLGGGHVALFGADPLATALA